MHKMTYELAQKLIEQAEAMGLININMLIKLNRLPANNRKLRDVFIESGLAKESDGKRGIVWQGTCGEEATNNFVNIYNNVKPKPPEPEIEVDKPGCSNVQSVAGMIEDMKGIMSNRFSRIDDSMNFMQRKIKEIEDKIDKLIEDLGG